MDSKLKISKINWIRIIIVVLCPLAIGLTSCKTNDWVDWKVRNELWLEQNLKKEGVKETSTGLQYKIIADPTPQDARPNTNSTVICNYTVKLINGYQVDGGNSIGLYLSNCIPGFTEGCTLIHNNGDIELYIPCYLGYDYEKYITNDEYSAEGHGTEGTQVYIPPYSTLIFTIHLCGVSGN